MSEITICVLTHQTLLLLGVPMAVSLTYLQWGRLDSGYGLLGSAIVTLHDIDLGSATYKLFQIIVQDKCCPQ